MFSVIPIVILLIGLATRAAVRQGDHYFWLGVGQSLAFWLCVAFTLSLYRAINLIDRQQPPPRRFRRDWWASTLLGGVATFAGLAVVIAAMMAFGNTLFGQWKVPSTQIMGWWAIPIIALVLYDLRRLYRKHGPLFEAPPDPADGESEEHQREYEVYDQDELDEPAPVS